MARKDDAAPTRTLERMMLFSDAVFAIAITLLVIDLHAPTLPRGASDIAQWHGLAALIPNFFGFALSFFVIGQFWVGHHNAFALAGRADARLLWPNLMLLMFIVGLPFVTAYLSANFGERVPTLCYNLYLVATALLNMRLGRLITAPPFVMTAEVAARVRRLRDGSTAVVIAGVIAVALSYVEPRFSQIALVTMPLWRRCLAWGSRIKT